MNVGTVRAGLETRLATIAGLRTSAYVPDSVAPPMAIVGLPTSATYDLSMGNGTDSLEIPIIIVAGKMSDRKSQSLLDEFVSGSGAKSIRAAIQGDRTLGGACASARITSAGNYGTTNIAGIDYLTVEFECIIYGGNS